MNQISIIQNKLGNVGLKIDKHAPEILAVTGTVMVIAGVIEACRATTKAATLKSGFEENMKTIEDAASKEVDYSDEDRVKDTALVYFQTGAAYARVYAPAALLTAGGILCFLGGHNIQQQRIVGLTAAYNLTQASYQRYRKFVADRYGADTDQQFFHGVTTQESTHEETTKGGKKRTVKDTELVYPEGVNDLSPYAQCFDESSREWTHDGEYNKQFLITQQAYVNTLLQTRGHVFLNDVYDLLGFERTPAGAVTGWVSKKKADNDNSDDCIDFGMYDFESVPERRKFISCEENCIWLDFNVDGVMYDLI